MVQLPTLSKELQNIAIDELGEDPERITEDLDAFKTWIQQQPHLKARTDDNFLIQYLRGCKYSFERAKKKIDRTYALRTKYPELFGVYDVDDTKLRETFRLGCVSMLPTPLNETGPRIVMINSSYDPKKHHFEDFFQPSFAQYEIIAMEDPYAGINGLIFVIDLSKSTKSHLLQATPMLIKKLISYTEKSLPLRSKMGIVIVPDGAPHIFMMLLSLLSDKLKKRFIFCNSIEELFEYVPLKYLPEEYGGENGSLNDTIMDMEKKLNAYRDYFKENAQYGTNESLRPGKPLDFDGVFSSGGTFRQLSVD